MLAAGLARQVVWPAFWSVRIHDGDRRTYAGACRASTRGLPANKGRKT